MKSYIVYDYYENEIAACADMVAVNKALSDAKPDGYEVWDGEYEDGEFVPNQRVMRAEPLSDDPRVNESMGVYAQDDTHSLPDPWWKSR